MLEEGKGHEEEDDEAIDYPQADAALEKAAEKVNKAVYINRDNLENEMKLE